MNIRERFYEYSLATVVHELIHVLVFSKGLREMYVDSRGETLPPNRIFKDVTVRGVPTEIFTLPKV